MNKQGLSTAKGYQKKVPNAITADSATNVTSKINGKNISNIFEDDGVTAKKATTAKYVEEGGGLSVQHAAEADHATSADTATEAGKVAYTKITANNGFIDFQGVGLYICTLSTGNNSEYQVVLPILYEDKSLSVIVPIIGNNGADFATLTYMATDIGGLNKIKVVSTNVTLTSCVFIKSYMEE